MLRLRRKLLLETLLLTAVASMNANDKKTAQAAFQELAHLRPDFHIDPTQFPPSVISSFDKARQALEKVARGRVAITSNPAGARIYLDEVPAGVGNDSG